MTSDEAIKLAQEVARMEGWPWLLPVRAVLRRRWFVGGRYWAVWTNAGMRGRNITLEIDDETGRVLLKGFLPR